MSRRDRPTVVVHVAVNNSGPPEFAAAERYGSNDIERTEIRYAISLHIKTAAAGAGRYCVVRFGRLEITSTLRNAIPTTLRDDVAPALRDNVAAALCDDVATALRDDIAAALRDDVAPALRDDIAAALCDDVATALCDDSRPVMTDESGAVTGKKGAVGPEYLPGKIQLIRRKYASATTWIAAVTIEAERRKPVNVTISLYLVGA